MEFAGSNLKPKRSQDSWKDTWRKEEMKRKSWNSYLITFPRDGASKEKNKFHKETNRASETPTKLVFHIYPLEYAT